MKTKIVFIGLIGLVMTACMPTSFFQIYKAIPSSNTNLNGSFLVYEDDNCKVSYNLWYDGGNIGFIFYNKTGQDIFLNLETSYFILNGISYNYYKNRVYTNSASLGASASNFATTSKSMTGMNYLDLIQTNRVSVGNSVGIAASSGYSVSYNEEKIVCIPSLTSKMITEYSINKSLYRDCDLFKYPTKKNIVTKNFKKSDSPFVFSNRLSYTIGKSENPVKFENEFYVSEITNYPKSEIIESKYEKFCDFTGTELLEYFKSISPDKFYIKYK